MRIAPLERGAIPNSARDILAMATAIFRKVSLGTVDRPTAVGPRRPNPPSYRRGTSGWDLLNGDCLGCLLALGYGSGRGAVSRRGRSVNIIDYAAGI